MGDRETLLPNEAEAAEYARAAAHRLGRVFVVGAFALAVLCGALSAGALAPFSRADGARAGGAAAARERACARPRALRCVHAARIRTAI